MTHEEAMDRVIKLLKLAKSDNPHEAALAAAKAQDIIDRYKLDVSSASAESSEADRPKEAIQKFADPLYVGSKASTWRIRLASALADANACRIYLQGGDIRLIGRPSDASALRYLFAYLCRETDKLTDRDAKGNGKTWVNNFRLGVIDTISRKLRESQRATREAVKREVEEKQAKLFAAVGEAAFSAGPSAIVRVNAAIARMEEDRKEVIDWEKANMSYGRARSSNARHDYGAREMGRRSGESIRIGGAKAALK
jgi:hypothetical protein